jgi:hypothetical protein
MVDQGARSTGREAMQIKLLKPRLSTCDPPMVIVEDLDGRGRATCCHPARWRPAHSTMQFFAAPVVVEFGKPIFLTSELRDQFDNRHRVKNLEMRCVGVPR